MRASAAHDTAIEDVTELLEHINMTGITVWECFYCGQLHTLHDMWVHNLVCAVASAQALSMGTVSVPWTQIYAPVQE